MSKEKSSRMSLRRFSRHLLRLSCASLLATAIFLPAQQTTSTANLLQEFRQPPEDARILMRWWWFGPAVEKQELEREILKMKSAGIGGFEIQPVYPLALDNPDAGFHNAKYLSDEFLDDVHFANDKAKELGLRADITLASGWPYGGPHVPVTQAAGALRIAVTPLTAGINSVPLPNVGNGESLLAAFRAPGKGKSFQAESAKQIALPASGEQQLKLSTPGQDGEVILFFLSSRTGQMVKRPALGAEGFVLDHFDRKAIDNHLQMTGDRLLQAFGSQPPYSVFSDSLEVYGSDWTARMPEEFQKRRGYDVTPYLPLLYAGSSEEAKQIRHDWGETLSELIE